MHVSRSTKPFTNHSWQGWRSIYNNHIDFRISSIMIWVHERQAKLVKCTKSLVQRYKAKHALRQNSTKWSNFLDFLLFMCFWIFWHKSSKRLIKNITKKCKDISNQRLIHTQNNSLNTSKKHTTKHIHKHGKYWCMDML